MPGNNRWFCGCFRWVRRLVKVLDEGPSGWRVWRCAACAKTWKEVDS